MSLGPLMIDLVGPEVTPEEKEMLQHPLVGGLIFFARHFESPDQIAELVKEVRSIRPELLLAVDQEGGRVQRFQHGFTRLPPMGDLGKLYNEQPEQALSIAKQFAFVLASEVRAVDVDFSFTPVLDLNDPISQIIADRALHATPEGVIALAQAFIAGLQQGGLPVIGKHFPGHGSIAPDSHIELPVDNRTFDEIATSDLKPFQSLLTQLDGLLVAHILYPEVDDKMVTFSSRWLKDILSEQMGYEGVIFSDDLSMGAVTQTGSIVERVRWSLEAGGHMALVCNDQAAAIKVLDGLGDVSQFPVSEQLNTLKRPAQKSLKLLRQSPQWQAGVAAIEQLSEALCVSA